jgi:hypothetical protein
MDPIVQALLNALIKQLEAHPEQFQALVDALVKWLIAERRRVPELKLSSLSFGFRHLPPSNGAGVPIFFTAWGMALAARNANAS